MSETPIGKGQARSAVAEKQALSGAPDDVRKLLAEVESLLEAGQADRALQLLSRTKVKSSWLANAAGVCRLRQGRPDEALDIFRPLVLKPVGATLQEEAPFVFKINYAVALLSAGNFPRFLTVWPCIRNENHPTVTRIHEALARGKQSLSPWQKLLWYTGLKMSYPVRLEFPLGDLA
jgi:hypothetical protein